MRTSLYRVSYKRLALTSPKLTCVGNSFAEVRLPGASWLAAALLLITFLKNKPHGFPMLIGAFYLLFFYYTCILMVINWKLSKRESSDVERMTYVKKKGSPSLLFYGLWSLVAFNGQDFIGLLITTNRNTNNGLQGITFSELQTRKAGRRSCLLFFFFSVCNRFFFFYFLVLFAPCLSEFFFFFFQWACLHCSGSPHWNKNNSINNEVTNTIALLRFFFFFLVAYTDFFSSLFFHHR